MPRPWPAGTLPTSQDDLDIANYDLDREGRPARRILDRRADDVIDVQRQILAQLRAIRLGIEMMISERIPDAR